MRNLLLLLCLLSASTAGAVSLRLHGVVRDLYTGRPMRDVHVKVYRDGVRQQPVVTGQSGAYVLVLENNSSYVIRFSAPGRVSKCYTVETRGGEWEDDHRITDLEIEILLFEPVEGLDLGWFDMPMGVARFMPATGHVAWSADHEREVRPEADRLTAEVLARREQALAMQRSVR